MRTAWRQPALIFFVISSHLLALLVIWWGIFFMRRVSDLELGAINALKVEALSYVVDYWNTPQKHVVADIPPTLEMLAIGPEADARAFQVPLTYIQDFVLVPTPEAEAKIHDEFERRKFMILTEGTVLLALVLTSLAAIASSQTKAFRLNWEMSNFLQAATHELKSPLASLRLLLETLKDQPEAIPEPRPMLEAGLVQIHRLERLIGNMLQTSALDAQRLRLHLEALELGRELRVWAKNREPEIAAREGTLTLDIPVPVIAQFDKSALTQILDNLLDNALKYSTGAPKITVKIAAEEVDAILSMTDQGIGLAPADVPRVFDRFWRAGDELTRTSEGTGLGLYLVRKLVTKAGGRVSASSPGPALGTTITVRLPKGSRDDLTKTRDLIPAG